MTGPDHEPFGTQGRDAGMQAAAPHTSTTDRPEGAPQGAGTSPLHTRVAARATEAAQFLDDHSIRSDPDATLRAAAAALADHFDNGTNPDFALACLIEASHRADTARTEANPTHIRSLAYPTPAEPQPLVTYNPTQSMKSSPQHQHESTQRD